jgi:hypothetical protein
LSTTTENLGEENTTDVNNHDHNNDGLPDGPHVHTAFCVDLGCGHKTTGTEDEAGDREPEPSTH